MGGVLAAIDGIAARRRHRLAAGAAVADARPQPPVVEHRPLARYGQRIEFEGSELVWQYYPGQGLQLQMLGNFGKLNGLWGSRRTRGSARCSTSCCRSRAERAGGCAWEYYFSFGGGLPPWVSGMAEGTAVQALARARQAAAPRRPTCCRSRSARSAIFTEAHAAPACACRPSTATTTRSTRSRRPARAQRLHPVARRPVRLRAALRDPRGTQLFEAAEREARARSPTYDTGAWSLYSRGSVDARVRPLLPRPAAGLPGELCERTSIAVYCTTASTSWPTSRCRRDRRAARSGCAAAATAACAFELSKISTVDAADHARRADVEARPFGAVGYGKRTFGWQVPRRRAARTRWS
jgi:hypothetical protein